VSSRFSNVARRDGDSGGEPATEPLTVGQSHTVSSHSPVAASGIPSASAGLPGGAAAEASEVDLARRRDELRARFAEVQWDLGGLAYEMAIRDHIRVDVLVRQAATLQDIDAELGEIERILRLQETGTADSCASCGAPHSAGAVYCWQCGQPLLRHVPSHVIGA
jgi:hypothetical protein